MGMLLIFSHSKPQARKKHCGGAAGKIKRSSSAQ
jgi:hypothetical protein